MQKLESEKLGSLHNMIKRTTNTLRISDVHRNGGLHVKGKNSSPGVKLIWLLVLSNWFQVQMSSRCVDKISSLKQYLYSFFSKSILLCILKKFCREWWKKKKKCCMGVIYEVKKVLP